MTEIHYDSIDCPYCGKSPSDENCMDIGNCIDIDGSYLEDDGDEIKIECEHCGMFYKIELKLEISRNYNCYKIEPQPVKEEIIKDVEGQQFFSWQGNIF